jgi:hypothetical protein
MWSNGKALVSTDTTPVAVDSTYGPMHVRHVRCGFESRCVQFFLLHHSIEQ